MGSGGFNFRLIWGIFMLIIYFGMAYLLTLTNLFNFKIELRIIFGICFFIYGLSRAYRIWKYDK